MKVYNEDVMNISQEITYALQDAKIIEGKPDNYNFIVDDVIREVLRKMLIKTYNRHSRKHKAT